MNTARTFNTFLATVFTKRVRHSASAVFLALFSALMGAILMMLYMLFLIRDEQTIPAAVREAMPEVTTGNLMGISFAMGAMLILVAVGAWGNYPRHRMPSE